MKTKIIFTALFLTVTVFLNAQLKVNQDGSVTQGYTGYANIYLGNHTTSEGSGPNWGIEVWSGNLNFWKPWPSPFSGDRNYYLFITEMGNMGIGKVPSTDAKLDVNGSIAIYGSVRLSSDERLKKDILPLTDKAINLYKLNAKSYKKHQPEDVISMPEQKDANGNPLMYKKFTKTKNKQKETTEYGFLAQELKEVYPDLVSQDTLGYYLVDYIGIIPIMVESLKEQKLQIDAQSKQISDLKELVEKNINIQKN
jgi:hypothetical protein